MLAGFEDKMLYTGRRLCLIYDSRYPMVLSVTPKSAMRRSKPVHLKADGSIKKAVLSIFFTSQGLGISHSFSV